MFSIAEHLNDFFDWISTLSFSSIVNTYWFLFFIEMPRYYILEYLVIGNRLMKRNQIDKEKEYAKYFLYREIRLSASSYRERTKANIYSNGELAG